MECVNAVIFASGVNFSIFIHFLCFFLLKLLKLGEIDGVKFLAWKSGGVKFLTNFMSGCLLCIMWICIFAKCCIMWISTSVLEQCAYREPSNGGGWYSNIQYLCAMTQQDMEFFTFCMKNRNCHFFQVWQKNPKQLVYWFCLRLGCHRLWIDERN